jgi:hypothetical protein
MNDRGIGRRTFLTAAGAAALTAAGALDAAPGHGRSRFPLPPAPSPQRSRLRPTRPTAISISTIRVFLNPIRGRASIPRTQPCKTTGWCRCAPEQRGSSS